MHISHRDMYFVSTDTHSTQSKSPRCAEFDMIRHHNIREVTHVDSVSSLASSCICAPPCAILGRTSRCRVGRAAARRGTPAHGRICTSRSATAGWWRRKYTAATGWGEFGRQRITEPRFRRRCSVSCHHHSSSPKNNLPDVG